MNILTLIRQHPLLAADLRNLGLPNLQIDQIADSISTQLGGNKEFNLCFILSTLSCREFVRTVDSKTLSLAAEISPALAQSVVYTIAPWVEKFQLPLTQPWLGTNTAATNALSLRLS